MSAGSIIIDLLMRTGSFVTDTGRAEKSLKKLKAEAYDTGLKLGDAFKGIAATAGITLTVGGIAQAFTAATTAAGQFADMAETTGAAAEDIAALSVAAATAGVPIDSVGSALQKLTKNLTGVDDESKAAGAALAALGLNVEEFKRLDPAAQYEALGRAINSFSDAGTSGAAKVAVAMAVMGKSGAEQLRVFKALEEQGGRTIILTADMIRAADEFGDRSARNAQILKLTAAAYATNLLPALEDLIDVGGKAARALLGIGDSANALGLNKAIREWADDQAQAIAALTGKAHSFVLLVKAIAGSPIPKWLGGDPGGGWRAYFDFDEDQYKKQLKDMQDKRRRIDASNAENPGETARFLRGPQKPVLSFAGAVGKSTGGARDSTTDAQRDLAAYVRGLESQIVKLDELSESQKALNFLQSLGTTGQIPQVRQLVTELAAQADTLKAIKAEEEDIAALRKMEAASLRDLDAEIDRLSGRADERRKIALTNRLEKILDSGIKFSDEELVKLVRGIAGIADEAERTKSLAEELGMTFSSAFEDAIVNGGKLSDIIRGLEKDILRLVTRELVTKPLAEFVTGAIKGVFGGGSGGGIGSFFAGLFGGRAAGGPVAAGGLYEVNERGAPELLRMDGREFLMMGNRRGWVDPSIGTGRAVGAGRTWAPVFNMHFAPGTTVATATQAGAAVARRLQAAAARNG